MNFNKSEKSENRKNLEKEIEELIRKLAEKPSDSSLENEIEKTFEEMSKMSKDSKEYFAMLSNLEKLCGIRSKEYSAKLSDLDNLCKIKDKEAKRAVSPDTIAVIAGNLLGIALILGYEKTGVIASKALGFVIRGRL